MCTFDRFQTPIIISKKNMLNTNKLRTVQTVIFIFSKLCDYGVPI